MAARLKILYHHRTRATDAQGIHIREMIGAFRALGHTVDLVSLVDVEAAAAASVELKRPSRWKTRIRSLPLVSEIVQLAYNFVGIPMLLRQIWRSHPNMLYERYSLFNFAGVLAARITGTPIVLEVNSPLALEQFREGAIRLFWLAKQSERFICRSATRVIVVSSPLGKMIEANGVPSAKIVLLPNGVNLQHFQTVPDSEPLRRSLKLETKVVIGFAGWFKKWHGLELLLEAFKDPWLREHQAVLLLIGDGPAMKDLKGYVKEHALERQVVFTGPVQHPSIPAYLALADIAVQPAANEYCCPMKILEYMGLGKAIVAPRQENIFDILLENEAEFFEPGSATGLSAALRVLVSDSKRRLDKGTRARRAIEDRGYLWTRNASVVVDIVNARDLKAPGRQKVAEISDRTGNI